MTIVWTDSDGKDASDVIKLRKNMLVDAFTLDALWALVDAPNSAQRNVALIKFELTKKRIAVMGDFAQYFKSSYLKYVIAVDYKQLFGNTLDLDGMATLEMKLDQYQLLRRGSSFLSLDYSAFDSQPRTDEIKMLLSRFLDMSLFTGPIEFRLTV